VHADFAAQWQRDVTALYETVGRDVLPTFFDRDATGLPTRWIRRMKRSIMSLAWRYNADRMVSDYVTTCYLPAAGGNSRGMPGGV
jgi:starch phosphorylase